MDHVKPKASLLVYLQALWGQAVICTWWVIDAIPNTDPHGFKPKVWLEAGSGFFETVLRCPENNNIFLFSML